MSHLTRSSTRRTTRAGRPVLLLSVLGAAVLVAGCLAYAAIKTMAPAPGDQAALAARTAQAAALAKTPTTTTAPAKALATTPGTAVPPAPAGWATVFEDTVRTEGGCLDVAGGGTASGTAVDWYPCNGTAAQAWTRTSGGELVNPKSGRCLADPGGSATARLDIATCAAARAQRWSAPTAAPQTASTTSSTSTTNTTSTTATAGAPPASFWGSTSAIPTAKHVLEVKVINQTNGRFPDSEVYWSFDGTEKSIAQQQYIDMPANSSGRMYFYLGSKNSKYFDFIEFTVGADSMNVDTTRVDRFGLKLALLARSHSGQTKEIGEDYATFKETRAATFRLRAVEPGRLLPGRPRQLLRRVLA
jgi:hypothetical protein